MLPAHPNMQILYECHHTPYMHEILQHYAQFLLQCSIGLLLLLTPLQLLGYDTPLIPF